MEYTLSGHEPWKQFKNIRCRNELCRCHDLGRSDGVEVSHRLGDGNIVRHCVVDSAELCHRLEDSLGVALFDPKWCTQDHSQIVHKDDDLLVDNDGLVTTFERVLFKNSTSGTKQKK